MQISKQTVNIIPRTLSATWTIEPDQDLMDVYTESFSDQLSKEISGERL